MFYLIREDSITEVAPEAYPPSFAGIGELHDQLFGFVTNPDALTQFDTLIDGPLVRDAKRSTTMFFETHSSFDFIAMNIPNIRSISYGSDRLSVFYNQEFLLFHSESPDALLQIEDLLEVLSHKLAHQRSYYSRDFLLNKILYLFFEKMSILPTDFLDHFEEKTYELEATLMESIHADYVQDIVLLRKDLFSLKKHYEQLLDVLDDLRQNENGFVDEDTLMLYKIFNAKVDRHYSNILSLLGYVTQVREAYQAQIDIEQNKIMKIFTVITATFFPLTLITGWYGMNLQMPEYDYAIMYPVVVIGSLVILACSLFYFKKKGWF